MSTLSFTISFRESNLFFNQLKLSCGTIGLLECFLRTSFRIVKRSKKVSDESDIWLVIHILIRLIPHFHRRFHS